MLVKLKERRELLKLTQAQVAKELNITQQTYSHYENEKRLIPISILPSLSNVLKLSINQTLELVLHEED